jgi:hypothetical protein
MIEASEPSTEDVAGMRYVACARPTGGSHGRTARGPAQRRGGAKRKAALSNRGEAEQRGQQHTHYKGKAGTPRRIARPQGYTRSYRATSENSYSTHSPE